MRTVVRSGPVSITVSGGSASAGAVSWSQLYVAGVASAFSERSMARTSKACGPGSRPLYSRGEVQGANAAVSSRHS